jgi:hypothetical protein
MGPSGSGKSTLLGLIAGLDSSSGGEIRVNGASLTRMDEDALARFRGRTLGFVFQSFQLIPTLTAQENVQVPLEIQGLPGASRRAADLLDQVGLADRAHHYPAQLSGGEQQRIAIAWPTNPPATWTARPGRASWNCCAPCTATPAPPWCSSRTTRPLPAPPSASCGSWTAPSWPIAPPPSRLRQGRATPRLPQRLPGRRPPGAAARVPRLLHPAKRRPLPPAAGPAARSCGRKRPVAHR